MALNWQTEYHRYRRYFVNISQFYRRREARVYSGIVLSIFTATFFLHFAIRPTIVTITQLLKEIKDKKMVVGKLEDKINALALAQEEYLLVQPDLHFIEQALPKQNNISVLVKQLEALAAKTGVTLENVSFQQIGLREKAYFKTTQAINYSLTASGSYSSLKSFLYSLTTLRRVILVDSFVFKSGKTESQTMVLNFSARAFCLEEN